MRLLQERAGQCRPEPPRDQWREAGGGARSGLAFVPWLVVNVSFMTSNIVAALVIGLGTHLAVNRS
jgi:hypothetical protein